MIVIDGGCGAAITGSGNGLGLETRTPLIVCVSSASDPVDPVVSGSLGSPIVRSGCAGLRLQTRIPLMLLTRTWALAESAPVVFGSGRVAGLGSASWAVAEAEK